MTALMMYTAYRCAGKHSMIEWPHASPKCPEPCTERWLDSPPHCSDNWNQAGAKEAFSWNRTRCCLLQCGRPQAPTCLSNDLPLLSFTTSPPVGSYPSHDGHHGDRSSNSGQQRAFKLARPVPRIRSKQCNARHPALSRPCR